MKSVGVMYLEAIRNFEAKGMKPLRNVYVTFVPGQFAVFIFSEVSAVYPTA
jgi:hypothetical protein